MNCQTPEERSISVAWVCLSILRCFNSPRGYNDSRLPYKSRMCMIGQYRAHNTISAPQLTCHSCNVSYRRSYGGNPNISRRWITYIVSGHWETSWSVLFVLQLTFIFFIYQLPQRLIDNDWSGHIRVDFGWFADIGLLGSESAHNCNIWF
jgi:hypothetical protein